MVSLEGMDGPELVRGAFEASTVGMAITDLDLRVLRVNAALGELLGRPERELLGERLGEPAPFHAETRAVRPDGAVVWLDLTGSVLRHADGTPRHHLIQAIDVTARKRGEAEAELARRRLADAQELTHVGSWEWNLETDELVWSDELIAIFGRRPEAIGDAKAGAWMDLVHPDDVAAVQASVDEARGAKHTENEYRIVRPDGEVRWLLARRRGLGGPPARRIVGTIQDITDRRAEATRRRDAEALFAQALEHAPSGMAVLDLEGRFVTVNPALCALSGFAEEELLARNFVELVHPDAREHALERRRAMLAGELERFAGEEPCLRPDGGTLWVLLNVGMRLGADGAPLGFIIQVQDATQRRAAAQALRDSERAALDASRMKSQFLANVSHEIRTPMNGVLGMLDALLHSGLGDEQQRHAETARRSAESLLTIIDDVLDFSKIEAGRLELEATPVDLVELLEELRHLLWPRARARGLRLVFQLDPGVPDVVIGDPVRLRQVLVNLITNAIKFSEEGEVVLSIAPEPGDRDRVRFAVADQGIGIDAETLGRLFEPFTQADASTTRRFGGTGLGLAISRQLAELMGGAIAATSTPGAGSTFRFTARLPAATGADAERPRPLAGVAVLLVDDHESRRVALSALLARWGAEATAAAPEDAPRALTLAAARGEAPAVAVLGDPAHGLLEALRARAGRALPAVVFSPGDAPPDVVDDDQTVGFASPVRGADLRDALARLAGVAPAAPAPDPAPAPVARPAEDPGLGTGRRVLVVEDNEVNQQVTLLSLRRRGFDVDVVGDGAQAVAASKDTTYDLILMDCQMPVMDGFAATAEIQARDGAAAAPIIAMTASSMAEDRERCRVAGMDDFVAKPVRADELDVVLRRWLEQA
jgi:PAS domain S-box-containing protein